MSKLKLLQLNVSANWGSTGKIAEGIGIAAMKRGGESTIAYGRSVNPSKSNLIKVGNKLNVYTHYAKNRLFDGEGLGSKRATHKLIQQIQDYAPDIIHLHNIHDHWLNYPILFKYLNSINTPVVWTFHDCWAFTGHCAYFDSVGCQKWKTECFRCPQRDYLDNSKYNYNLKKSYLIPLKDRLTIVSCSEWLTNLCKQSFLSGCRLETIHNGIDTQLFNSNTRSNNKVILGVALPWSARKGLEDIFKLRALLSSDIKIKLVGLNKKQIKSLPPGITGIERTQNIEELANLYNEASLLINPTHQDNFPTVNIEALACGTPVVTYRTGGSPEAIDKDTGIVVEKGDVNAMANAIMQVIETPFDSELCRKRAVENFNKERQFDKYIDLYEDLLQK